MQHLKLDDLITFYNRHKVSGAPSLTRLSFGKMLYADRTDQAISTLMSNWGNPDNTAFPSYSCMMLIAAKLKMDINDLKKFVK